MTSPTTPPQCTESGAAACRSQLETLLEAGNTAGVFALLNEVAQQRDEVAQQRDEVAQQRDEVAQQRDEVAIESAKAAKQCDDLQWRVKQLALRVKHLTRVLYGRRSEKLTAEELGQLVLAYDGTEANANSAEPTVPVPEGKDTPLGEEDTKKRKKRKHPGRNKLSVELERRVTDVQVPADERHCVRCEVEMGCIGYLHHERVEYEPARLVVHVERREKLGCKTPNCGEDAVTADRKDMPVLPIRVGASFLAHLIESKCEDSLPVYRQMQQLKRLGFDVPVNTLYGYWRYATELLLPIAKALLGVVLSSPIVGLDDTRLDVLDSSKPKGKYRGHLWCFTGPPGPLVAYAFTKTWKAKDIEPWISAIDGVIQCDDYKGYSSTVRGADGKLTILVPPERRLGCMMHVRRRFYEALKLGDKRADQPVALIKDIYRIEKDAKTLGLDADGRLALRNERSLPLLNAFDDWVDDAKLSLGRTSPLARAVNYSHQQRTFVRRCFSDGRFEIDNGHTERQIRKPAVGRRNYLFTGSAAGAERLASTYSIVQSCRALGIPLRDYLIDVIEKLEAGWPMRRLTELLPHIWAHNRGLLPAGPLTT
ncbi:MAG: IS66 family transposase [bacterium]|nr:IS66 family transposase [bacterium]